MLHVTLLQHMLRQFLLKPPDIWTVSGENLYFELKTRYRRKKRHNYTDFVIWNPIVYYSYYNSYILKVLYNFCSSTTAISCSFYKLLSSSWSLGNCMWLACVLLHATSFNWPSQWEWCNFLTTNTMHATQAYVNMYTCSSNS